MKHAAPPDCQQVLLDRFGRVHTSLRISVTDRCNIRCFYCMPPGDVQFRPRAEILSYEEIDRFVRIATRLGVRKLRLTGGEPLVRVEIWKLIERLGRIDGIQEVALTTNGMLLVDQAEKLKTAGLDRLNISLDTLREETFEKISRRQGLAAVLAGIAAAQSAGFEKIRLNALSIRGLTEEDIVPLARFARQRKLPLRFIEFMPLDADRNWQSEQVLSGAEVRKLLERTFGPLLPSERTNSSQPAVDYQFADQCGQIGFINPVTAPFCSNCNRLRITAEGKIRNCLFSTAEWDVRQLLRDATIERSAADKMIAEQLLSSVAAKKAGHGINSAQFVRPERAMYQIGG